MTIPSQLPLIFGPSAATMHRLSRQCRQILAHLQQGKTITRKQAIHLYGCVNLPGRIFDLKEAGHHIDKQMQPGGYAEYRLIQEG